MRELRQADPQPVRVDLGIMQAGGVERGGRQQQRRKAQPAAAEPARCRLDIADRAAVCDAVDRAVERPRLAQLVTFSAPTDRPACSIMP
jgi:hypothetical protein